MNETRNHLRIGAARAHDSARRLGVLGEALAGAGETEADERLYEWDRELAGLYREAEALDRFATLYAPTEYGPYDPVATLRQIMAAGTPMDVAARGELQGDRAQVAACVALFRDTVCAGSGSDLDLAVYGGDQPRIQVTVTERIAIPESLRFIEDWRLSWDGFDERWRAATSGGTAVRTGDYAVTLTLSGDPVRPSLDTLSADAPTRSSALKRALGSWRNAIANHDTGYASLADTVRLYARRVAEARAIADELFAAISAAR